jgi:hypothetical protein
MSEEDSLRAFSSPLLSASLFGQSAIPGPSRARARKFRATSGRDGGATCCTGTEFGCACCGFFFLCFLSLSPLSPVLVVYSLVLEGLCFLQILRIRWKFLLSDLLLNPLHLFHVRLLEEDLAGGKIVENLEECRAISECKTTRHSALVQSRNGFDPIASSGAIKKSGSSSGGL